MKFVDILLIVILISVLAGAVFAIYHEKKKGKKCIGCPHSSSCHGSCGTKT